MKAGVIAKVAVWFVIFIVLLTKDKFFFSRKIWEING